MFTVFLIIQIMIIVALVAVILLQRSEGGALGMGGGGGGGMGGLMTGRGAANLLTRTTAILAAGFFATSIILTVIVRTQDDGALEFGEGDELIPVETSLPGDSAVAPAVPEGTIEEDAAGADATPVIDTSVIDEPDSPAEPSDDVVEEGAPVIPDSE